MSTGSDSDPIHPSATRRSGFLYQFTGKHHGRDPGAARWLPSLSRDDEFAIFDAADANEISDERGWHYGVRARDAEGDIPELGTWGQQVAEFPYARANQPWHGYPLWPLVKAGPENRRGERSRPSREVFEAMERAGMITPRERKRLYKGDHV